MSEKRPTMKDVAKLANVSIGTVSKFINGNPSLSKDNFDRINEAVEKLNYIPNTAARGLACGESNSILLYIINEEPITTAAWMYDLPIIQGITVFFSNSKYSLQLAMDSIHDANKICDTIITRYSQKSVCGVVIISPWRMENEVLANLNIAQVPYVLIGSENQLSKNYYVIMDSLHAVRSIVGRLAGMGHKRIAMINGLEDQFDMQERLKGFEEGIMYNQLYTEADWNSYGEQTIDGGYLRMLKILDITDSNTRPTAVVCGNDHIAAGVIQAIRSKHLRIPEDISVIGFDDIDLAMVFDPALSTVKLPTFDMGVNGAKMMLRRLSKTESKSEVLSLPCSLLTRASIGPAAE